MTYFCLKHILYNLNFKTDFTSKVLSRTSLFFEIQFSFSFIWIRIWNSNHCSLKSTLDTLIYNSTYIDILLVESALIGTTNNLWELIRDEGFNYQTDTSIIAFLVERFLYSLNAVRFTKLDSI